MAPKIMMLKDLDQQTRNYTVQVIIVEKGMPHLMTKSPSYYQRLLFQDIQGNQMQGILYSPHIDVLGKSLKIHHTYAITNAPITKNKETYRFVENPYQLTPNSKTPVEEIKVDNLSARALRYNFTPLADLKKVQLQSASIDTLFAVLHVGPRKERNGSFVTDLQVIDQGLVPTTISLWDQYSEYEAAAFHSMPDSFPTAIGTRLKLSKHQGISLATRPISGFIFNPNIPEAAMLQTWCMDHASEIKQIPFPMPSSTLRTTDQAPPTAEDIIKIINVPTYVEKEEYISIQGMVKMADRRQKFLYWACSKCNKSTTACGNDDFWCNICNEKVPPQPRMKIILHIEDDTAHILATMFQNKAAEFYQITAEELKDSTTNEMMSMTMLEKLCTPKPCIATIKAYMYQTGSSEKINFNITSIFSITDQAATTSHTASTLPTATVQKRTNEDTSSPTSETPQEQNSQPLLKQRKT